MTDAVGSASLAASFEWSARSQGVGKSCLVLRYVRGQFDAGSKVTIGAAFMSHTVSLPSGASVKFEIWCANARHSLCTIAWMSLLPRSFVFNIMRGAIVRSTHHGHCASLRNHYGANSRLALQRATVAVAERHGAAVAAD